jgi:hypothetical protein
MTLEQQKNPREYGAGAGFLERDLGQSCSESFTPKPDKKQRSNWPNSSRKTAHRYGRDHRKNRTALLAAEPNCRLCAKAGRVTVATIADHQISLARWPHQSGWGLDAYQPICIACDRVKRSSEGGQARARKCAALRFLRTFNARGGRVL